MDDFGKRPKLDLGKLNLELDRNLAKVETKLDAAR